MLLRSGRFMVGRQQQQQKSKTNSMKLMASLAPARAEVESGVVAKADQKYGHFMKATLGFWILELVERCIH